MKNVRYTNYGGERETPQEYVLGFLIAFVVFFVLGAAVLS